MGSVGKLLRLAEKVGFPHYTVANMTFVDGFAPRIRDALPNASFIGFTGTPSNDPLLDQWTHSLLTSVYATAALTVKKQT